MLSGGALPAVKTGAMDTRWQAEAGPSAPTPRWPLCPHAQRPWRRGLQRGFVHLWASGPPWRPHGAPARSLQGLLPSARAPGARRWDTSLSVRPAARSLPAPLPGGRESLALEDGSLRGLVSPCPLRAGAPHWAEGRPSRAIGDKMPLALEPASLRWL